MPDFGADRRYRELVRLSYLVLPGGRATEVRLALARRIVDRSLPHRPVSGSAHAEARRAVLRRSMRPPRRLRWRLLPWLHGLPAEVPDNRALALLCPEERAAYVLRRVLGMRRYAARDVLVDLGLPDVQGLLDRVEAMPELDVVTPGPVGVRRARRPRAPLAVALAVTCAAAGVLAAEERGVFTAESRTAEARTAAAPPVAAGPAQETPAAAPQEPVERVLWEGRLPGRGGEGRLACRTVASAQGAVRYEGLFTAGGESHKARECSDGRTGLWWHAPDARWYYLAAGPSLDIHGARERDGLVYVRAERSRRAPQRAVRLG